MKDFIGRFLITWPTILCTTIAYTNYGIHAAIITLLVILTILVTFLLGLNLMDE